MTLHTNAPAQRWPVRLALALAGGYALVLALALLKSGAHAISSGALGMHVPTTTAGALGMGWLMAYLFLSGSPPATIAVSLFAADALGQAQALAMIIGSRCGAASAVLVVGFIYQLRGSERAASLGTGVAALVTTLLLAPLVLAFSALLLEPLVGLGAQTWGTTTWDWLDVITAPPLDLLAALEPPGWSLVPLGALVLLGGFKLFDAALPDLHESERFRLQFPERPLALFVLGMLVTTMTLSVSVSVSLLVPLAARGTLRRAQVIPYVMGANITALVDTLVAAGLSGAPAAPAIVLTGMIAAALASLTVLMLVYAPFAQLVEQITTRVVRDTRALILFLAVVILVPIALLQAG